MGIVCLWVSVFLGPGRFIPRPMGEPPWLKVHSRPKGTQVLSCLGDKNERTYGRKIYKYITFPWDIRHFPRDSFDLIWFVGTKQGTFGTFGGSFFWDSWAQNRGWVVHICSNRYICDKDSVPSFFGSLSKCCVSLLSPQLFSDVFGLLCN